MLESDKYKNFGLFFLESMKDFGKRAVIEWKEEKKYRNLNGNELTEKVYECAKAIEAVSKEFGIKEYDKAAILSENRWEWIVADFGSAFNKLITIPIYTTTTPLQIQFVLEHSETKICFVSNQSLLDKILKIKDQLPELKLIVCFNEIKLKDNSIINFNEFLKKAHHHKFHLFPKKDFRSIENYLSHKTDSIEETDIFTIIYTSGTTGLPKGVCLTHNNILSNILSCQKAFEIGKDDVFLSYLPLAHTYERTAGYYFPISVGTKIVYAQSIDSISTQLVEVKPTVMTSVPILFEKMYSRILKNSENYSYIRQKIFKAAIKLANQKNLNKNKIKYKVADKLVYSKVRERLGGRMRFFISGGAALKKDIANIFDNMGILILEGYGMTEASPVISVNRVDNNFIGTVGLPLDGVNVKISEESEILVQGKNVMEGYYKNDEETKKTIIEGWLYTGDIGEIDEKGRIKITDRKKTLYKTAGGKYISLTHIEDVLSSSKYIDQIMTTGGDRMFVTALIVPDFEELKKYCIDNRIEYANDKDVLYDSRIVELFQNEINKYQEQLAKYERVRRFKLISEKFTIENGELTPTLKLKRKIIEKLYSQVIEDMYVINKI